MATKPYSFIFCLSTVCLEVFPSAFTLSSSGNTLLAQSLRNVFLWVFMVKVVTVYLFGCFSLPSITHKRGFGALRGRHLVVGEGRPAKIQTSRTRHAGGVV